MSSIVSGKAFKILFLVEAAFFLIIKL